MSVFVPHVLYERADVMAYLLQDSRVRAIVNVQDEVGNIPLFRASYSRNCGAVDRDRILASILHHLLQASRNPALLSDDRRMPLVALRARSYPSDQSRIALLEQVPDAEKAALLVKARRLAVAANSDVAAPSCMQGRVARGQSLPGMALVSPMVGTKKRIKEEKEGRKLRITLFFSTGLGSEAMPWDVVWVVIDLLMPRWDPLRSGYQHGAAAVGLGIVGDKKDKEETCRLKQAAARSRRQKKDKNECNRG